MFAIIDLETLKALSDRELKVFAVILALSHKGKVKLSEIMEFSNKGKTQTLEIINNLQKKGIIKRKDRGFYEIEIKLSFNFEIYDFLTIRDKKRIQKIIEHEKIPHEEAEKILNYMKNQKRIKDKAKYFAWIWRNYKKVFSEKEKEIDNIEVFGRDIFFRFQQFLSQKKIKFSVKPEGSEKWRFFANGINFLFKEFIEQKNKKVQV
jgi:predicted transcriptional regulator